MLATQTIELLLQKLSTPTAEDMAKAEAMLNSYLREIQKLQQETVETQKQTDTAAAETRIVLARLEQLLPG